MNIPWAHEPLSDEAKRLGIKPFDYRAQVGSLTLCAYQFFTMATWVAVVWDKSLGLAIGGTFLYPLADEYDLPDLASAQAKAEELAQELATHPGVMPSAAVS
jgi:hypothetical protein